MQGMRKSGQGVQAGPGSVLASVQYLRAIAAWLVVFFHLTASMANATGIPAVFTVGAIGVDIFFVLSGFLMAMIVDRSHETGMTFLMRRFIRIAPLYYVMTFAVFAVALMAPWLLNSVRADVQHLVMSLAFLPHDDGTGGNQPILSLGWTLNYEMFFYVLVVIFAGLFRDRSLVSLAAFLVVLAFGGTLIHEPGTAVRFYTDPIILEFGFGIMLYRIVFRERQAQASEGIWWIALAASVMLIAASHDITQDKWRFLSWGIQATLLGELPSLQRFLRGLAILAAVAPLLGLLGTVTGIIQTFAVLRAFGNANPSLMAGGISEALVTTVGGLVIAVPILLLHSLLNGRSDHLLASAEKHAARVLDQLAHEARPPLPQGERDD